MINDTEETLQNDINLIQQISIIPKLLDVVCQTTGMRFAAIARVTEDRWVTCSVKDDIEFGLLPGSELKLETTICNEIRTSHSPVVIDHVAKDAEFCNHHTPALYGFQSYISYPIFRKDGRFFGTLCAIDPEPAKLKSSKTDGLFQMFTDLIAFHLNAVEQVEHSERKLLEERTMRLKIVEEKNTELLKTNSELESFAYIASHDLQEPLRKINTFSGLILQNSNEFLTEKTKEYFTRLGNSVNRMQLLINDLLAYTRLNERPAIPEKTDLAKVVQEIKDDYKDDLTYRNVTINIGEMCNASIVAFQFYQLMQNLMSNSIKFARKGVDPVIDIDATIEKGNTSLHKSMMPQQLYCHITFKDNGIGFESEYNEKIFKIFQRLNSKEEYQGTGIGLAIVKKIVDNHNGFITAKGETNVGVTFDIFLPHSID